MQKPKFHNGCSEITKYDCGCSFTTSMSRNMELGVFPITDVEVCAQHLIEHQDELKILVDKIKRTGDK